MDTRLSGKVLWFHPTTEFGFILPDDGRAKLYVHKTSVRSKDNLVVGESVRGVQYMLRQHSNMLTEAVDVTGLDEDPIQGGGGGGRDSIIDKAKNCTRCGF